MYPDRENTLKDILQTTVQINALNSKPITTFFYLVTTEIVALVLLYKYPPPKMKHKVNSS